MNDKIQIHKIVEEDDGGATIEFYCDKETQEFLIGQGLLRVIEQGIKNYKEEE